MVRICSGHKSCRDVMYYIVRARKALPHWCVEVLIEWYVDIEVPCGFEDVEHGVEKLAKVARQDSFRKSAESITKHHRPYALDGVGVHKALETVNTPSGGVQVGVHAGDHVIRDVVDGCKVGQHRVRIGQFFVQDGAIFPPLCPGEGYHCLLELCVHVCLCRLVCLCVYVSAL